MAERELGTIEEGPGERKQIDCVEIYLPKSIEFLSELYLFLREKVQHRLGQIVLDGFSTYEVDGVFQGEKLWEQRTLVIRLLFVRTAGSPYNVRVRGPIRHARRNRSIAVSLLV